MKIAIDTHFISSGRATGNRTYTAELVQSMISLETSHEFILYAISDHPYYDQFSDNERVKVRKVLSPTGYIRNFIDIPRAVYKDSPDVVHLLFICPPFLRLPSVLTVHDMFYCHNNDLSFYNKVIGRLTKWSVPRSDMVITISEYSRQDIINTCSVAESKIVSVPLGIDTRFVPVTCCEKIKQKLNIIGNYILYVGRTEDPRKNLLTLIEAYAKLKKSHQLNERLVIAGRHGHGTDILFKKVAEQGLHNDVIFPGIVEDEELPALLSGAKLVVYVSSFEGFGLPVLEAMACGAPVITSNVTSLPEVAGDAALMVSPGKVDELAKAMELILTDPALQSALREKGLHRVKQYIWSKAAQATIRVYEQAIYKAKQLGPDL